VAVDLAALDLAAEAVVAATAALEVVASAASALGTKSSSQDGYPGRSAIVFWDGLQIRPPTVCLGL